MLFAVLFFLMGCRPSLIFLPTVPGAGDGGNRTYTVETSEALASAVANAKNGDSIVLENLILSPDWDKLPLKLTSNVKISGNLSISKDSSQIANLAKFKSRVLSEDAIHIFEIDDNVLVSFEEFNVTVSDSAKEFVKAIIHVNKGNTTFSQISMSSDTVLVELGVEASSESVSGSIDGIVIEIVPENPSAFEIAQEIADKTNAKPSIGGESFSDVSITINGYGDLDYYYINYLPRLKNDKLVSFILYGKAGTGKTTIALILKEMFPLNSFLFNASTDSKQTLKEIVDATNFYENVIVIIDEIHRLKKDTQDYLKEEKKVGG